MTGEFFIDCCSGILIYEHDGGIFTDCPECGKSKAVSNVNELKNDAAWDAETRMQGAMLHGID